MRFDPRCILIDRAHIDKVRGKAELKLISRELKEFEQSAAQAMLVIVTPEGVRRTLITMTGVLRTEPPSLTALKLISEAALRDCISEGVVAWILLLDEPALSGVRDWLDTTGTRFPSAPLACLPNDGALH